VNGECGIGAQVIKDQGNKKRKTIRLEKLGFTDISPNSEIYNRTKPGLNPPINPKIYHSADESKTEWDKIMV
jgi:hypothetical protein